MAVGVSANPASQPSVPRLLFKSPPFIGGNNTTFFAVTGDGQRFLMLSRVATNSMAAIVVLNWTKLLKQ
jgi:hypothetical protein